MVSIKEYMAQTEKKYKLRIKTVVPLTDELIAKIENVILKYNPIEVERATKTILQRSPMDFKNVENSEVWIIDVVFGLPASPVDVREEVRKALDAPETYVVVRTRNEPMELQTAYLNAVADIEKEDMEKGLIPASVLSTEPDFPEYDEVDQRTLAGNEYNNSFLYHLAQVQKERGDLKVKTSKDSTLFNWMKMPDRKDQEPVQDTTNFNKDIKGAPVVSPKKVSIKFKEKSIMGDIDEQEETVKRIYQDKNGKRVVLSRKMKDAE